MPVWRPWISRLSMGMKARLWWMLSVLRFSRFCSYQFCANRLQSGILWPQNCHNERAVYTPFLSPSFSDVQILHIISVTCITADSATTCRYLVSKLLQLFAVREIADRTANKDPFVIVNSVSPGLCTTNLTRSATGMTAILWWSRGPYWPGQPKRAAGRF